MHDAQIRYGVYVKVRISLDNRRLKFCDLREDITAADVGKTLTSGEVDGVVEVEMDGRGSTALVLFESHKLASKARRKFFIDCLEGLGDAVTVDWANPLYAQHVHRNTYKVQSFTYLCLCVCAHVYALVCMCVGGVCVCVCMCVCMCVCVFE